MQKTPMYKRLLWLMVAIVMVALPALSLAESYQVVKGGYLNLRKEASTTSSVLGQYPTGTWMTVMNQNAEWSKVKVAGKEGFVMSKYLSDAASSSTMYIRTNTGANLNMRSMPAINSAILKSFANGSAVNVLVKGREWFKVSIGDMIGFMSSRYLVTKSSGNNGSTNTTSYPKTGVVKNPGANQVLLLRETPSTQARVLGYYGNGVAVTLLGESGSFYKVSVDGSIGYMMKKYIKVVASVPAVPAPPVVICDPETPKEVIIELPAEPETNPDSIPVPPMS